MKERMTDFQVTPSFLSIFFSKAQSKIDKMGSSNTKLDPHSKSTIY
jgi:hypothetical protein